MPRRITSVGWSASNVPYGMIFSETTGTFEGTPEDEGEYVVPVKVRTNYGEDQKDVLIVVGERAKFGKVYAIGADAARWSNNAVSDIYGFRELPIPQSSKLVRIPTGFSAKTAAGSWYIGSTRINEKDIYGDSMDYYTTPQEYPVSGVSSIAGGARRFASSGIYLVYFAYKKGGEVSLQISTWNIAALKITSTNRVTLSGVKQLPNDFVRGMILVKETGELWVYSDGTEISPEQEVSKVTMWNGGGSSTIFYVTTDGELYKAAGTGNPERILPDAGSIVDVWSSGTTMNTFALTQDGDVYARGSNSHYELGLPEAKTYSEFTLVGRYNAKKVSGSFMLSQDGRLYHSGPAISGITSEHNSFTQIYPDNKFYDIEYLGMNDFRASETLICIKEG